MTTCRACHHCTMPPPTSEHRGMGRAPEAHGGHLAGMSANHLESVVARGYHGGTFRLRRRRVITEVITFKLRAGMTREDVVAMYRKTAPIWRANPECIRKCYLYDGERGLGGGAYLWKSI